MSILDKRLTMWYTTRVVFNDTRIAATTILVRDFKLYLYLYTYIINLAIKPFFIIDFHALIKMI